MANWYRDKDGNAVTIDGLSALFRVVDLAQDGGNNFWAAVGMIADGASYKFGKALEKRMAGEFTSASYEYGKNKVSTIGVRIPGGRLAINANTVKGIAYGAKGLGVGLGAYNFYEINNNHNLGKISMTGMVLEQGSNAFSVVGSYGVWWGVSWEMGRAISTTSEYQNSRDNTVIPAVGKVIDWFR